MYVHVRIERGRWTAKTKTEEFANPWCLATIPMHPLLHRCACKMTSPFFTALFTASPLSPPTLLPEISGKCKNCACFSPQTAHRKHTSSYAFITFHCISLLHVTIAQTLQDSLMFIH